jgi:hypothetical protein
MLPSYFLSEQGHFGFLQFDAFGWEKALVM